MDKSKKKGIRAILKIRGQWDNNWILSRFKRLCLVFKAIISLAFFPITSFDHFDEGLEVGAYDCYEVGNYYGPHGDVECTRIYVHKGLRHWTVMFIEE